MGEYIIDIDTFQREIENGIQLALEDASRIIYQELLRCIETYTYVDMNNADYFNGEGATGEFLNSFDVTPLKRDISGFVKELYFNPDKLSVQYAGGGYTWNAHASIGGEDVREDMLDILNVSGIHGLGGKSNRQPYLDLFMNWLENNFKEIIKSSLYKYDVWVYSL